ncbi:hypothetical protein ACPV38_19265, partial [Photobacterium damselae]
SITTVPALVMSTVCITFILNNHQFGFGLPMGNSTGLGVAGAIGAMFMVIKRAKSCRNWLSFCRINQVVGLIAGGHK